MVTGVMLMCVGWLMILGRSRCGEQEMFPKKCAVGRYVYVSCEIQCYCKSTEMLLGRIALALSVFWCLSRYLLKRYKRQISQADGRKLRKHSPLSISQEIASEMRKHSIHTASFAIEQTSKNPEPKEGGRRVKCDPGPPPDFRPPPGEAAGQTR